VSAALRGRPQGEAITEAALTPLSDVDHNSAPSPEWTTGAAAGANEPVLIGEYLKASATAEFDFAEVVAERTGYRC
jgi:hypothetical protein